MRGAAVRMFWSLSLTGIVAIIAGCHACQKISFDECCQAPFERVEVHYELDGFRGGYWSRALSLLPRVPGEPTPNEMPDFTKGVTCQRAEIHILCPHPEQGPHMARAVVRLWHQGRPMTITPPRLPVGRKVATLYSKADRRRYLPEPMAELKEGQCDPKTIRPSPEIFLLDFRRWELEMILADLLCGGFFDHQKRPNGGVHLIAEVDGKRVRKEWTPEPRLDDLLTRVSVDGRRIIETPDDATAGPTPVKVVPGDSDPGRFRLDGDAGDLPLPPAPAPAGPGTKDTGMPPGKSEAKPRDGALPERPELPTKPLPPEMPNEEPAAPEAVAPPFEDAAPDDVLPPPLPISFSTEEG